MTERDRLAALLWEEMRFVKGATDARIGAMADRLIAAGVTLAPRRATVTERDPDAILFLVDRLVHVYGESPNLDYLEAARRAALAAPAPSLDALREEATVTPRDRLLPSEEMLTAFLAGIDSTHHSPESRREWARLFMRDYALAAPPPDALRAALDEAVALIETGENRAMAADGPVPHFRGELDDREWRRLWVALSSIRALATTPPAPVTSPPDALRAFVKAEEWRLVNHPLCGWHQYGPDDEDGPGESGKCIPAMQVIRSLNLILAATTPLDRSDMPGRNPFAGFTLEPEEATMTERDRLVTLCEAMEREWLDALPPVGRPIAHGIFQRLPDRLIAAGVTPAPPPDALRAALEAIVDRAENGRRDTRARDIWNIARTALAATTPQAPAEAPLDDLRAALKALCEAVTEHVSPTHRKGMSHAELGARLRKARTALAAATPQAPAPLDVDVLRSALERLMVESLPFLGIRHGAIQAAYAALPPYTDSDSEALRAALAPESR